MWTKLLNWLGILTKTQQQEQARIAEELRRAVRAQQAARRAQKVITSPQVPKKSQKPKPPVKPTGLRRGPDTDWNLWGPSNDGITFADG